MPAPYKKVFTDMTEDELLMMTREEACLNLNDKQRKFCEKYVQKFNVILAAKQAGYSPDSAHTIGWKIRQNPECQRYIAWLKVRVARDCHVDAMDIIDHYARIAFADITDFVSISGRSVALKDASMIDGQLVQSVRHGKDGITVELYDKMKALDKLEKFFDVMPKDWHQKIEERKVDLLEQRVEIERIKAGQTGDDTEDDGFIEALKGSAEEVWGDDE